MTRTILLLPLVGAACLASDDADHDLQAAAQASEVTAWQNIVGVAVDGNDLTKTSGLLAWDAGASSVATLETDGYLEFTGGTVGGFAIGLSNGDASTDYREIDHAFHVTTGLVRVRENGALRGGAATYAPGERFRIQVQRGVVTLSKSGTPLWQSTVPAAFPVRVDTAFYRPGSNVRDVVLVSQGVTWQNAIGVATDGNGVVKTAPETTWAAGAASTATIGAIGYVEATTDELGTAKAFGLSRADNNQSYVSIDYAFLLGPTGALRITERGVDRGTFGSYVPHDWLRIEVEAGVVRYLRNGLVLYTSAVAPRFPLRADTALRTPGATLRDVVVHDAGFLDPGTTYVKASNPGPGDRFGGAIAIGGQTMVVGADWEPSAASGINGNQADNSLEGAGAAYVFVHDGTTWTQEAYVKASNPGERDFFGRAVAIAGNTMVVAAPEESSAATGVNGNQADDSATASGAVYVFVRDGTTWSQQAYLKADVVDEFGRFGEAVAISGDRIVVGAPSAEGGGAVYVFRRNGTVWTQDAKFTPDPAATQFGAAVAIEGATIAIGSTYGGPASPGGSVRIVERVAGAWQVTQLIAPAHATQSTFGAAIALSGDTLAVGGILDTALGRSASVFVRPGPGALWTEQAYLAPPTPAYGFQSGPGGFGFHLDIAGNTLVVADDTESTYRHYSGAAWRYERDGTTWGPPVLVKAPNGDPFDQFGSAVAIGGGHIAIGAEFEASTSPGVGADQTDDSAYGTGAVYTID